VRNHFISPILNYVAGKLVSAHEDLQHLLGNIAEIVVCILFGLVYIKFKAHCITGSMLIPQIESHS
jgi:hypothetical protein